MEKIFSVKSFYFLIRRFGGTCSIYLQDQRISQALNQREGDSNQRNRLAKISGFIEARRKYKTASTFWVIHRTE
jgi:hypothetical protein